MNKLVKSIIEKSKKHDKRTNGLCIHQVKMYRTNLKLNIVMDVCFRDFMEKYGYEVYLKSENNLIFRNKSDLVDEIGARTAVMHFYNPMLYFVTETDCLYFVNNNVYDISVNNIFCGYKEEDKGVFRRLKGAERARYVQDFITKEDDFVVIDNVDENDLIKERIDYLEISIEEIKDFMYQLTREVRQ